MIVTILVYGGDAADTRERAGAVESADNGLVLSQLANHSGHDVHRSASKMTRVKTSSKRT